MLHFHDVSDRPVEMVCDEGYLLLQPVEAVAIDPPGEGLSVISNSW